MPKDLFTGQIDDISIQKQDSVDLFEKYNVKPKYKSIIPENLPAPIQAVKEQVAQRLINPMGNFLPIPQQAISQVQRGQEIGALQGINAAGIGIPQFVAHQAGYEIPQAQTPIEQGMAIPLEAAGSLVGISPFSEAARMLPLLRKAPATIKSAATLAGYGATKAGFEGEDIGKAAISGALMGGVGHLGSRLGATTPLGQRIGGALGFGATSAGLAALEAPEEERAQQAALQGLIGTGMGLMGKKAEPFKGKQPAQYAKEATNEYRTMLRPTQGETKNIEIRQKKNIDDYYRIAAEEGLQIKQTPDRKLDTTFAREQLQPKQDILHQELNTILESNPNSQFDLVAIGNKAKNELAKSIKNAKELKSAIENVDDYIIPEIERNGRYLTGSQLNEVKKGMWSTSYDMLKPNSQNTARKIGFIAKEEIENAYPEKRIKELNELSGKYATLSHLLENAHGRVIQGGAMGRYFARTIGAVAGTAAKLPFGLGPFLGALGAEKVSKYMTSPERISKIASKKAQKAGISEQSFNRMQERINL